MEGSPLGNAFGDAVSRGRGKKSFLLIAVAAALGLGGTVLASNITVNSGGTVEFGQGVATTEVCDSEIVVTPTSTYDELDGEFYLNNVTVSEIDPAFCGSVNFTVSVYASGTATPVAASSGTPGPDTSILFDFSMQDIGTSSVNNITVETN